MHTDSTTRPRIVGNNLRPALATIVLLLASFGGLAGAAGDENESPIEGSYKGEGIETNIEETKSEGSSGGNSSPARNAARSPNSEPQYSYIWVPVSQFSGCGADLSTGGAAWDCAPHPESCEAGTGNRLAGRGDALEMNDAVESPVEGVTQRGTRIDNESGESTDLGVRCALPGTAEHEEAPPVVITVTQEDFARMPVKALEAHAGPAEGWLPVNMVNVLYTESGPQELSVELLDTPVAIRATPVSYHWDLGDGNTITTSNPGKPYPSETISATYTQEGWYDITLTTTFSGQFSVAGGEWQDIDGTIEVSSDPVPVYSKSLESRLVNGDVPVDEDEDPWIPARTADTEGPSDPHATHRTI